LAQVVLLVVALAMGLFAPAFAQQEHEPFLPDIVSMAQAAAGNRG